MDPKTTPHFHVSTAIAKSVSVNRTAKVGKMNGTFSVLLNSPPLKGTWYKCTNLFLAYSWLLSRFLRGVDISPCHKHEFEWKGEGLQNGKTLRQQLQFLNQSLVLHPTSQGIEGQEILQEKQAVGKHKEQKIPCKLSMTQHNILNPSKYYCLYAMYHQSILITPCIIRSLFVLLSSSEHHSSI